MKLNDLLANNLVFQSPYQPQKIKTILEEQIDSLTPWFFYLITLSAFWKKRTSPVCGIVSNNNFEIRNNKNPLNSLRAIGCIKSKNEGTEIRIIFKKPLFPDFISFYLLKSYKYDRDIIIEFLKEWIKIKDN